MKSRVNRRSLWTMLVRALSFSAVTALTLNSALAPVVASDYAATPMVGGGQIKARFLALGFIAGRLNAVVFTGISGGIRVISFRKASLKEVRSYDQEKTAH